MAVEYLGGKCVRCGYDRCHRALHFHHEDPSQKSFQIGGACKSWDSILDELEKCILVCSNCHAEIEDEL